MRKLHLFVRIDNHAGLSRIFGSDYLLTLFYVYRFVFPCHFFVLGPNFLT
jgi:hypothetical protein